MHPFLGPTILATAILTLLPASPASADAVRVVEVTATAAAHDAETACRLAYVKAVRQAAAEAIGIRDPDRLLSAVDAAHFRAFIAENRIIENADEIESGSEGGGRGARFAGSCTRTLRVRLRPVHDAAVERFVVEARRVGVIFRETEPETAFVRQALADTLRAYGYALVDLTDSRGEVLALAEKRSERRLIGRRYLVGAIIVVNRQTLEDAQTDSATASREVGRRRVRGEVRLALVGGGITEIPVAGAPAGGLVEDAHRIDEDALANYGASIAARVLPRLDRRFPLRAVRVIAKELPSYALREGVADILRGVSDDSRVVSGDFDEVETAYLVRVDRGETPRSLARRIENALRSNGATIERASDREIVVAFVGGVAGSHGGGAGPDARWIVASVAIIGVAGAGVYLARRRRT